MTQCSEPEREVFSSVLNGKGRLGVMRDCRMSYPTTLRHRKAVARRFKSLLCQ